MAHALRKVFSREDKDWQESIALSRRVRSEVLPSGSYAKHGNRNGDDEGDHGEDDENEDNHNFFRGHVEESIETAATIATSFDNKEDSFAADLSPSSSSPAKKSASSSSPSSAFASPMALTRARSTNYTNYKNSHHASESPNLAYALRKVFSRDHPENANSSEWTAREAKGLLVPRVSSRVVVSDDGVISAGESEEADGGGVGAGGGGEAGAELVLESYRFGRDEVYYDEEEEDEDEDGEDESYRGQYGASSTASSSSKKMSPTEFMNQPVVKESGGYSLKRIFSNPEKQRVTAPVAAASHSKPPLSPRSRNMGKSSAIISRNSPGRSFKGKSVGYTDFPHEDDNNNNPEANGESPLFSEGEGYEVGHAVLKDNTNTHEDEVEEEGTTTGALATSASRLGRLSKPISLIRNAKSSPYNVGRFSRKSDHAISPVKSTSAEGNGLGNNNDDDVSTIAESIGSSSSSPSHSRHDTKRDRNGIVHMKSHRKKVLIMLVAFGLCAMGVGVFLSTQKSSSNKRSGGTIQVQSTNDGNSNDYGLMFGNDDDGTVSNGNDDNNDITLPPSDLFPNPTTSTQAENDSPTSSPTTFPPTTTPTLFPSTNPSTPPSTAPTSHPTRRPTRPPTFSPTASPTLDTTTVFYVIADAPYSDEERENIMPRQIDSLGEDAEFLVHVGDLEYVQEDNCEEWAYEIASDILKRSKVPVFVLPGDNDMNDCDDIEEGEYMWRKYFRKFDERWDHDFELTRWGNLDESFSFLHHGVLFFGINIVGGSPYSKSEAQSRHAIHLSKLKNIMQDRYDEYQLVVLFGHAEPASWHDDLFLGSRGLATFVEDMGKPFLHLHGDWHEWYEVESSFDVSNYLRISLDAGEFAPPIRVMIDSSRKNPVRISRRASDLDVECCRHGWPRLSDDDDDDDDDWYDDGWDDD